MICKLGSLALYPPCEDFVAGVDALLEEAILKNGDEIKAAEVMEESSTAMCTHRLLEACRAGCVKDVRRYIALGASLETPRPFLVIPHHVSQKTTGMDSFRQQGLTPLMYAAQGGYHQVCEVLVAARANVL